MAYTTLNENSQSTDLEMNEETITITAFIPKLSSDTNRKIYQLSRTVRLLSMIDLFFGLFMFIFGNIGGYILMRLLCSISGYYGAKNYDYCLSNIYLSFLIVGTFAELVFIYYYRAEYNEGKIQKNILIIGICYQLLFFILKAYITRFVCIFTSNIARLSIKTKDELKAYDTQPVEIVYW